MKIKKSKMQIDILCGIVLMVCVFLYKSVLSTYVSLACLFAYCVYAFIKYPEYFIKYMMYFYSMIASIIGCLICEFSSLYLNELDSYAHFVGATPLLVFCQWIIMMLILFLDRKYERKSTIYRKTSELRGRTYLKYFTYIYLILSLILFLQVINHPSFLLGMDRVSYASAGYVSGLWLKVANFMQYLVVVPIMYIFHIDKKRGILFILPYVLYLFWTGNKFGTFFNIFYIILFVIYGKFGESNNKTFRKILLFVIISIFALIVFSLFAISFSGNYIISDYFFNRVAQQGQMWWKTFDLYYGEIHPEKFINEIYGLFSGKEVISDNVGSNYGIYNLMYLIAPKSKIDYKIMAGSRYTEATFGCILYYFGVPGLILSEILIAFIAVKLTNFSLAAIKNDQLIRAMLLLRLYLAFRGAVTCFVFFDFIDPISIFTYFFLIFSNKKNIRIFDRRRGRT